jgi:glycine dehydrogenase subunit 2
MPERAIFELSGEGRQGVSLPECDVPQREVADLLPSRYLASRDSRLPELSEVEVVRHFVRLSTLNHHVDRGFYPLGSCTMKYNPKVNEDVCRLPGFARLHPLQPESSAPAALRLMGELARYLCEIAGMDGLTLQPAAGAHGELAGLLMIRAYHEKQGNPRLRVLIPDSAHGTNPASVTLAGYLSSPVKSTADGLVDIAGLEQAMTDDVAGLMLTNPNTLGLFETEVVKIAEVVHRKGGLLYMDGANLNALLGIARPGDMGFDVVHINLHKTFSTPHGGGGPGSGPVGVKASLLPYLPMPAVRLRSAARPGEYVFDYGAADSIGKLQAFYGNFGIMVRAYTYIRTMGPQGLCAVSENALLNANYLMRCLQDHYDLPHRQHCMHEFVLSGNRQKARGVKTLDIAKRLLDFGMHAPTIYFPLIVPEALMIEPTETESKQSLDDFVAAMLAIAEEVEREPEKVRGAPHTTPVGRLDEARAAKDLDVSWKGDQ